MIFFLVTFFSSFSMAQFSSSLVQTEPVQGVLLEKGTRQPLVGVNLFLLPHKMKAVSDKDGKFVFPNVPRGDYQLVVNQTGYYRFDKKYSERLKSLKLYLEKKRYDYFETTVVAKAKKRDQSRRVIGQEEFLTAPGAGKDPVKAVQNLPGINRSSGGNSQIVIQGADPDDTKYLIDGHEIPLVFHFGGLSSIVTPEAVDGVDYLSAGYGPEYGRAIGGLIQLRTRSPKKNRWQGFSFFDNFNAGGLVEGPVSEKSQVMVSGRYAYIGPVLKEVLKDNEDFNLSVAPTFWDITSVYEYELNSRNKLKFTALASEDTLEFVLAKPVNNDPSLRGTFFQRTQFSRIISTWDHKHSENAQSQLSVAIGQDQVKFDLTERFFRVNSNTLSARGEYQQKISDRWTSYLGFDNNYARYDLALRLQRTFSSGGISNPIASGGEVLLEDKGPINQLGLYTRQQFQVTKKWSVSPNLRFDSFRRIKRSAIQPRVSTSYQMSPSLLLKSAVGLYYQDTQPEESTKGFGNTDLNAPRATHFMLGFEKDFRGGSDTGWTLGSQAFFKSLEDLVISSDRFVVRDGQLVAENYRNAETGTILGAELETGYRLKNASVKLAYTFLQSRRKSPGVDEHPAQFDQTHSMNLLGRYEWDRWVLAGRFRYVTGNPETPVLGAVFDADSDTYIPLRGSIYSGRSPDFFQLDVRADRKWIFETWILSLYLDIQNVLNTKNVESRRYSFDYSQSEDVNGLMILPSFGLKAEF